MKARIIFSTFALGALLFALSVPAEAQQPGKVPRIGLLAGGSLASSAPLVEAFRQGLRELGYVAICQNLLAHESERTCCNEAKILAT
jgi:putative ABC transport system substrate-binding protein